MSYTERNSSNKIANLFRFGIHESLDKFKVESITNMAMVNLETMELHTNNLKANPDNSFGR